MELAIDELEISRTTHKFIGRRFLWDIKVVKVIVGGVSQLFQVL